MDISQFTIQVVASLIMHAIIGTSMNINSGKSYWKKSGAAKGLLDLTLAPPSGSHIESTPASGTAKDSLDLTLAPPSGSHIGSTHASRTAQDFLDLTPAPPSGSHIVSTYTSGESSSHRGKSCAAFEWDVWILPEPRLKDYQNLLELGKSTLRQHNSLCQEMDDWFGLPPHNCFSRPPKKNVLYGKLIFIDGLEETVIKKMLTLARKMTSIFMGYLKQYEKELGQDASTFYQGWEFLKSFLLGCPEFHSDKGSLEGEIYHGRFSKPLAAKEVFLSLKLQRSDLPLCIKLIQGLTNRWKLDYPNNLKPSQK